MIRHLLFAMFIGMLILFLYIAQYVGAFRPVNVGIENREEMTVVYKEHFGAYHKIVPVIESVETWFKEQKLNCKITFGEYLDNPKDVDEGRLRSLGGCVVDAKEAKSLNELPQDFKIKTIPARRYVIALFDGSPGIGPIKVYPKVEDFFRENKLLHDGAVIEAYEIHSQKAMTTTYFFPAKSSD